MEENFLSNNETSKIFKEAFDKMDKKDIAVVLLGVLGVGGVIKIIQECLDLIGKGTNGLNKIG